MVDGAEFLIGYQRLAFLSILSQRIQNSAPSTILWRQSILGTNCHSQALKAYVSQEILNWHSLRHSHSAEI